MSQASWLVAGIVPGIERHPLKKLEPSEGELLRLLMRWRAEATQKGRPITRIAVAFEAGRDGFWLARWLRARGIEAYVIHPTSVAVSREHRRAKTDRLDTGLLKRVFLGWLRGEPDHCHMAAIPTLAEEDAKRPNREREGLVRERTRLVNRMKGCLVRFGVRTFKPTLRNAPDRLAALRTPEGVPLPPNTLLELRLLAAFGDHAASRNRRSIRSRPARPNICRLSILSRLICPSVCPLLQPSVTAARTAPSSASSRLANRRSPTTGPSCAALSHGSSSSGWRPRTRAAKPSASATAASSLGDRPRSSASSARSSTLLRSGRRSTAHAAVRGVSTRFGAATSGGPGLACGRRGGAAPSCAARSRLR